MDSVLFFSFDGKLEEKPFRNKGISFSRASWLVVAGMKELGNIVSKERASPLQYIILIIIGLYEGESLFTYAT